MIDTSIYIASNQRPQNVAFVKAWKQAYGEESEPDLGGVGAWSGMTGIFAAVKQLGAGATGDAATAVLSKLTHPDGPQGPISSDPETRDVVQDVTIAKVEKAGDRYVNVPVETIANVRDPWKLLNPAK